MKTTRSLLIMVLPIMILSIMVLLSTGLASAQVFTITDIGANVAPVGINKYAQVAVSITTGGFTHAGIWYRGRTQNLDTLPGAINTFATGINNHGDVVGNTDDDQGIWWPSPHQGSTTDVSAAVGGINILANGINDFRVITGEANFEMAYIWSSTTTAEFFGRGPLDRGRGVGIDNRGNVAADGDGMAFLWNERDGGTDTGIPNSFSSAISGGYIAGQSGPDCGQIDTSQCDAFIWSKSTGVHFLGHLSGQLHSASGGINAYRQIVGSSGNHAFFWTRFTGILDLNDLVKGNGWVLVSATAINDRAEIVGLGTLNGVPHGFLLTVRQNYTP